MLLLYLILTNPWQWTMYGHDLQHTHLQSGKGAMNTTPIVKWSYVTGDIVECFGPCLADIQGDDRLEVIFGSSDKKVYALNHDGSVLWSINLGIDVHDISIGDIDCDSCLELAVGTWGGLSLWVIDDAANTHGCDIPSAIEDTKSKSDKLELTVMNDRIMFCIPYSGEVNLRVYDLCGRLVVANPCVRLAAGSHTMRLSELKSGIYFAQLVYNAKKYNAKLLIIK